MSSSLKIFFVWDRLFDEEDTLFLSIEFKNLAMHDCFDVVAVRSAIDSDEPMLPSSIVSDVSLLAFSCNPCNSRSTSLLSNRFRTPKPSGSK